ncbi:hypothetical protein KP77_33500 [Jeotgalibacillus alimentarius]|uniref:Uncharacterized protein n=1 Tax=Jeotgalibacillus alimentarius TaxID=135826 RepID=A0A0C2QXA4_9BACL|nr:hypothetical protein [Jeotgalibacillus alimentarius]KIL42720.1 hypothetical protein KP77_33500 [Jeotgalibacillus alimentarius]
MKRLTTTMFSFILLLSLATPAFASGDASLTEAVEKVEQKNDEIYDEIENGVTATDALRDTYFKKINEIEEAAEVLKLKQEKTEILIALEPSGQTDEALNAALSDKEEDIKSEEAALMVKADQLKEDAEHFTANAGKAGGNGQAVLLEKAAEAQQSFENIAYYFALTSDYEAERDAVIQEVYDIALELTEQGIQEAAANGLLAECSWVHVRFGDTREWIDPIQVVGIGPK